MRNDEFQEAWDVFSGSTSHQLWLQAVEALNMRSLVDKVAAVTRCGHERCVRGRTQALISDNGYPLMVLLRDVGPACGDYIEMVALSAALSTMSTLGVDATYTNLLIVMDEILADDKQPSPGEVSFPLMNLRRKLS